MENHFMKFRLCFQKCKKYKISLNPKKCFYGIFKTNFRIHNFQGRKNTRPQKGSCNNEYVSKKTINIAWYFFLPSMNHSRFMKIRALRGREEKNRKKK